MLPSSVMPTEAFGGVKSVTGVVLGTVVGVAYNGTMLRPGIDYSVTGTTVTFTFSTQTGDTIYVLCY